MSDRARARGARGGGQTPRGGGPGPGPGPGLGSGGRGIGRGSAGVSASGAGRGGYPESSGGQGSGFAGGRGGGPQRGGDGPRGRGGRGSSGFDNRGRGGGGYSGPVIFAASSPANIDPRLSTANLDKLVDSFKKLEIKRKHPLRPGYGKLGHEITLRTNFFALKVPKGPIYDYSVEISPKTDIKRLKNRIFELLEKNPLCAPFLGHIAHDRHQRLVSAKTLPQPLDISITFVEEGQSAPQKGAKVYDVSIILVRELDTSQLTKYLAGDANFRDYDPIPLISALNLVLQQHPVRSGGVRVGKNRYFFPSPEDIHNLGLGVDVWKGFYTSVRPTYKQLMVNVNVCMTAFYTPGNLADAMLAFQQSSLGSMPREFKKGIKVTTTHLGYKMKKPLKAITSKTARNTFFDCQELGGNVSVEEYFKKKYKITLKHANDLPVVDIGSAQRTNYLPAELCSIDSGVPYGAKLNETETANMIRYACNPPRVNAEAIVNQGLPKLGLSRETVTTPLTAFGITIDTEMAVIPARELPAPGLTYKSGRPDVRNGSWNILDVKFQRGAVITSWWVLVVRDGREAITGPKDPALIGLVQSFAAKCKRSGMTVPDGMPRLLVTPRLPPPNNDPSRAAALGLIRKVMVDALQAANNRKPSFILVLLSARDNYIYPGIKRLGDVLLGLHTVHMQLAKALKDERKQDQYLSNVALKVNTKLGGVNHTLDPNAMQWLTARKTMVVGMDVTHPSPNSREGTPSIAAVVASIDGYFVQFPASMRVQEGRKEMVQELKEMMTERLLLYEKKNKTLPEKIVVYRDGVSEGQFDIVVTDELTKIEESFKKFNTKERKTPYRPKLTIVICGKRHHGRFYPTNSAYADKNGNTRPGTVVDKGVTAIYEFDWYLQAHAGLQGTVRPTHYTVVYDENNMSADEVQQGTHTASYLYGRATKAVSLVPAAYYADLACERGRCYLNEFLLVEDQTSTASGSRAKRDRDEEKARVLEAARKMWGAGIHPDLRDSMFYL